MCWDILNFIKGKICLINYQLISLAIVLDNVAHVYPYTYFINKIHLFLRMQFLIYSVCVCVNIRIKNHRHFLTFYLLLLLLQLFVMLVASIETCFRGKRTPTKITLNKIETFPWHKIYVIL